MGIEGFGYEDVRIPYTKKTSNYLTDVRLPNGIIIETKGYFSPQDRSKHLLVREQHPNIDLRFVFTNPNTKISKISRTTYGSWCSRHGFLYATGLIPDAWILEPVNDRSLAAIKDLRK